MLVCVCPRQQGTVRTHESVVVSVAYGALGVEEYRDNQGIESLVFKGVHLAHLGERDDFFADDLCEDAVLHDECAFGVQFPFDGNAADAILVGNFNLRNCGVGISVVIGGNSGDGDVFLVFVFFGDGGAGKCSGNAERVTDGKSVVTGR